jgi:hypothetical protein
VSLDSISISQTRKPKGGFLTSCYLILVDCKHGKCFRKNAHCLYPLSHPSDLSLSACDLFWISPRLSEQPNIRRSFPGRSTAAAEESDPSDDDDDDEEEAYTTGRGKQLSGGSGGKYLRPSPDDEEEEDESEESEDEVQQQPAISFASRGGGKQLRPSGGGGKYLRPYVLAHALTAMYLAEDE